MPTLLQCATQQCRSLHPHQQRTAGRQPGPTCGAAAEFKYIELMSLPFHTMGEATVRWEGRQPAGALPRRSQTPTHAGAASARGAGSRPTLAVGSHLHPTGSQWWRAAAQPVH